MKLSFDTRMLFQMSLDCSLSNLKALGHVVWLQRLVEDAEGMMRLTRRLAIVGSQMAVGSCSTRCWEGVCAITDA